MRSLISTTRFPIVLGMIALLLPSAWADTYVVAPNGSDDTAAIQAAIDSAIADGTGSVVQLTEGTFYTSQVTAMGFEGTLRGMGKDATVIEALPNLSCGPAGDGLWWWLEAPGPDNPWPFLFSFVDGDLVISDLSLLESNKPAMQSWGFFPPTWTRVLWALVGVMGENPRSAFDNVHMSGQVDPEGGVPFNYNLDACIWYIGFLMKEGGSAFFADFIPLGGSHTVTGCSFQRANHGASMFYSKDASFVIGGTAADGNTYYDCTSNAMVQDLSNGTYEFSYNEVTAGPRTNAGWTTASAFFFSEVSDVVIAHNVFDMRGGGSEGILCHDYGRATFGVPMLQAEIFSNTILADGISGAGIHAAYLDGALIQSNRIVGSGLAGILLEGTTGCMVRGNNLQGFDATTAALWLNPDTVGNTVIGGPSRLNVLDEGIDNSLCGK